VPAQSPTTAPAAPPGPSAEHVAAEQKLRQSSEPSAQVTALALQATQCGQPDVLAGHDDPTLPLVTCAADGQTAYLLAPSILGNEQIDRAAADLDPQQGGHVVDLVFTGEAAGTWADFTATHIGTATAFTLDSQVVSAPQIQQAIAGGRTQISGNFTAGQARELATALSHRALPVVFDTSRTEHLAPKPASSNFGSPEFALIGGGFVLMIGLIGGLVFVMLRERT
ncbi:MAG TPA: protein translocase subunit SecD, partial [Mycobacterium sp.]|nr:protein translocase subunit SecD [Mycobacterium sp.]